MHKTVGGFMILISGYRLENDQESRLNITNDYILVNCCGYEKYITKSTNTLRKNGRPDFQIIYVASGCGQFLVNGNMTELGPGKIIIYRPGETQHYAYQSHNSSEVYWVHFTGYGAYDMLEKVGLADSQVHNIGMHNICIEYFNNIIREFQLKPPFFECTANAALLSLMACMGRFAADTKVLKNNNLSESIKNVVEQMHTKYNCKWTISALAKQCNLSPDWFMHKFKSQIGLSPMEYLTRIRLDKAKWLILNSSLSIKEISYIVGYENPLYFSKLFKKEEGVSPTLFRNSNT